MEDTKIIMRRIGNVQQIKVNREQNRVAHDLAQHARHAFSSAVWLANIPSCIEHVVHVDYNVT